MKRVGITGGIGSGKSTVSRIFESLGVPVYYTDPRAKELMVTDPDIVREMTGLLGPGTYSEGRLDTKYVASKIFTDKGLIMRVNSIVHYRVADDFLLWTKGFEGCGLPYAMMECAILFESGFAEMMDYIVTVSADIEQRITRASSRDGIDADHVRERMANQMDDLEREMRSDFTIHNSDSDMVVPRVIELHKFFTDEGRKPGA